MGNLVCEYNKCIGCNGCLNVCPKEAITVKDEIISFNSYINAELCIHCGKCTSVCPVINEPDIIEPIDWKQGWTNLEDRIESSSGGAAQAIIKKFLERGGIVVSCRFLRGRFVFSAFNETKDIKSYIGSKYVKSDTGMIYRDVTKLLKQGKAVLFIGLPCQVAALKSVVNKKEHDKLFTIDLICHGSPTQALLEKALKDYGVDMFSATNIRFRANTQFALNDDKKCIVPKGMHDRFTVAFLKGYIYTNGCYECKFARKERVADITLGDSWGSELKDEIRNGISLILIQTEKGKRLLEGADLKLLDVNIENSIKANHQLSHPSVKPLFYENLMNDLKNENHFRRIVFKYAPKDCINQYIKLALIKTHILGGG